MDCDFFPFFFSFPISQGYISHPNYSAMSILTQGIDLGLGCVAVNKDSMYAAIKGTQSVGHSGPLITLIKAEHPTTAVRNITWTVVSTTPSSYFQARPSRYGIDWSHYDLTCDVDRNSVFTLRYSNGAAFRYIPSAPKISMAQTCSSSSDGLGEWRRTAFVDPEGQITALGDPASQRRLVFREEDSTSTMNNSNGNQSEREVAIYYSYSLSSLKSHFYYTFFDKMAYRSRIREIYWFSLVSSPTDHRGLVVGGFFMVIEDDLPCFFCTTHTRPKTLQPSKR